MRKIFRNNKIKICLILFFCIAVILASVLVPKYLLARTLFEQMDQVVVAPEEYYVEAGEMMARSASSNLSSVDRIKLIAGTWESEMVCSRIPCRLNMIICFPMQRNFIVIQTAVSIRILHICGKSHLQNMMTVWNVLPI